MWSFVLRSLLAGTLAFTAAKPGTVSELLYCYLLASHFGGFSSDLTSLSATSVVSGNMLKVCR